MKNLITTFLFAALTAAVGCATTQQVTFSGLVDKIKPRSAYLAVHGGKSSDMDVHIERDLRSRGLKVVTGPDVVKTAEADILVKHSDRWRWDIVMYLEDVHITFYDAKSADLLATGLWQNSAMHKFRGADVVIKGVMDEIFTKIKVAPQK